MKALDDKMIPFTMKVLIFIEVGTTFERTLPASRQNDGERFGLLSFYLHAESRLLTSISRIQ